MGFLALVSENPSRGLYFPGLSKIGSKDHQNVTDLVSTVGLISWQGLNVWTAIKCGKEKEYENFTISYQRSISLRPKGA